MQCCLESDGGRSRKEGLIRERCEKGDVQPDNEVLVLEMTGVLQVMPRETMGMNVMGCSRSRAM
jgi:hypothetical protein